MKKNIIFCYSGTGNCLASAKQLGAELGMEIVHITNELVASNSTFEGDVGIIIFPVYAYGMPKTVKRFIRKNKFAFEYFAVLTTFGSRPLGAYGEAIRLLRRRKQRVAYTDGAISIENFVHMFKLPTEERIAELTEIQHNETKRLAESIRNRKRNRRCTFRPISSFISFLFRTVCPMFAKRYKVTDACTGCEVCYKICPATAITMQESRPKFLHKKCDHCQGCMQLCPARAIRFGKIKPDSRRYKHSDVSTKDMIKR